MSRALSLRRTFSFQQFDESLDHPDLRRFRELIRTLSDCANDSEERNYSLGRDRTLLLNSIDQLQNLLVNEKGKLQGMARDDADRSHLEIAR